MKILHSIKAVSVLVALVVFAGTAQAAEPSTVKRAFYKATAGYSTVKFTPGASVGLLSVTGAGCAVRTCKTNGIPTIIQLRYSGCGPVTVRATAKPGGGKSSFEKTWVVC